MIYLLEDDPNIRRFTEYGLKNSGFEVTGFERPSLFWAAMEKDLPDLLLLDLMLPEEDGLKILNKLRNVSETKNLPVILLTAKGSEYDKIIGFDCGADDYVTKPFSPSVLMKRVAALIRRSGGEPEAKTETVSLDGLTVDEVAHVITLDNRALELTLKEYNILLKLLSSVGRVFSREQLLDDIWGYDYAGDIRTVDSHVARLRTKLGSWGDSHLKTVYGIGYKIEAE